MLDLHRTVFLLDHKVGRAGRHEVLALRILGRRKGQGHKHQHLEDISIIDKVRPSRDKCS